MKENTCWCLELTEQNIIWRFSTQKLAEMGAEFFDLDAGDYEIYPDTLLDDQELLRRIKEREERKKEYSK